MFFAPFIGVNGHRESILLGVWLISSEDTETFTWFFQNWLQCLYSKVPMIIITDQDKVIKSTISIVFPDIHHRFCLWHLRKLPEKLCYYGVYKSGLKISR